MDSSVWDTRAQSWNGLKGGHRQQTTLGGAVKEYLSLDLNNRVRFEVDVFAPIAVQGLKETTHFEHEELEQLGEMLPPDRR